MNWLSFQWSSILIQTRDFSLSVNIMQLFSSFLLQQASDASVYQLAGGLNKYDPFTLASISNGSIDSLTKKRQSLSLLWWSTKKTTNEENLPVHPTADTKHTQTLFSGEVLIDVKSKRESLEKSSKYKKVPCPIFFVHLEYKKIHAHIKHEKKGSPCLARMGTCWTRSKPWRPKHQWQAYLLFLFHWITGVDR